MGKKFGKFKMDDLKKFQKQLNQIKASQVEQFIEGCTKELAARLLAKVIKRTPVGNYSLKRGKKGGALRRGWTAQKNQNAAAYVQSLKINHFGDTYVIEIVNPVVYASYVEFGHRTANHKGWVKGKFMMTISEQELETIAPKVLESKINKFLGGCFK